MGIPGRRRRRSVAEQELARIEAEVAAAAVPPAAGTPPAADGLPPGAEAHMEAVGAELTRLLGVPPEAMSGFMGVIGSADAAGTGAVVVLEQHEGPVARGQRVGLLLLPHDHDPAAPEGPDALLGVSAAAATVRAWDAATSVLVLDGVDPTRLTVGSMISG